MLFISLIDKKLKKLAIHNFQSRTGVQVIISSKEEIYVSLKVSYKV